MVADNRAMIIGGRNIGDAYFGFSDSFNFRDLDLLAFGPSAQQSSTAFDRFWNSNWVVAASALPVDDEAPDIGDSRDFTFGVEIRDLLAQLPEKYLEPLLLQNLMGMSCEEIAAVIGLTAGATMTRLTRARLALAALMQGQSISQATPALRLVKNRGAK